MQVKSATDKDTQAGEWVAMHVRMYEAEGSSKSLEVNLFIHFLGLVLCVFCLR